jgi:hypothetical protein
VIFLGVRNHSEFFTLKVVEILFSVYVFSLEEQIMFSLYELIMFDVMGWVYNEISV